MFHKLQNRIPQVISILGILYIVSPIAYYLHAYFVYAQASCSPFAIGTVLQSAGSFYMPQLIVAIVLTPIVGVGLVLKRKWGLYLFIGYGVLLIAQGILNYAIHPGNFSISKIIVNIIFIFILLLFVRIDLRAPFYRADWAIREKRHKHAIAISYRIPEMDGQTHESVTVDISEGGYFVAAEQLPALGEKVVSTLDPHGASIQVRGKVSWLSHGSRRTPKGFGMMFEHQDDEVYKKIAQLITEA